MKAGKLSLLGIDLAGGLLTAFLLGWGIWSVLTAGAEGPSSLRILPGQISQAKADLAGLRRALEVQNALEIQFRSELASAGAMPAQVPQETHLKILSGLAAQNHLSVVRQLPLAPREYPGLLEQRFAYEVTGAMADLARFFKAVETSPSWTDISYLKLEHGKKDDASQRSALLTFSAFSKAGPTSATDQGG